MRPVRLIIRTYQVGFGDCFLLSFDYGEDGQRHVLMDFGSTSLPKGAPKDRMLEVARDIALRTEGKLTAVVATHRHKDHISGFATSDGEGSGDIIAGLNPDLVLQPWTEDPDLEPDAKGAPRDGTGDKGRRVAALASMHEVARLVLDDIPTLKEEEAVPKPLRQELEFLGDDNLSNLSAVKNLMTMGSARRYLSADQESGLEDLLPGVETLVLGPPTIAQSDKVLKQRSRDENEFWHLRKLAGQGARAEGCGVRASLFPNRYVLHGKPPFPEDTRWLIYKAKQMRGEQMLGIVRALDKALNNTSLILLFRIGGRSLLFPGDAQIENWSYALEQDKYRELLAGVDVYKVGHHGSLNATPKTLWGLFDKRSPDAKATGRLQSLMSTMPGKHGKAERKTEVPRETLVTALQKESNLFSTDRDLTPADLCRDIEILFD
ncbi:MAG TPA: hypothetical protein VLK25_14065 [Allosphingosinicella sp.]|nr:hypothetical protein [Allosphingosinicella sp.]